MFQVSSFKFQVSRFKFHVSGFKEGESKRKSMRSIFRCFCSGVARRSSSDETVMSMPYSRRSDRKWACRMLVGGTAADSGASADC